MRCFVLPKDGGNILSTNLMTDQTTVEFYVHAEIVSNNQEACKTYNKELETILFFSY